MSTSALVDAVRADGLLAAARPVLVMVSGGRDSVCLFDVAVQVAGAQSVRALHVNYGLRAASALDEELCRSLGDRLGVEVEVRRPARERSGNLHAWAREERYRIAFALADGADVAAGHTATDQVETILYRLASSPSRRALLGMSPREGALVRPLLSFTRDETAAYCVSRGLAWREDESNDDPAFARARVRHGLLPALRGIHPAAERNVLTLAGRLREEAAVLDELVDEVLGEAGSEVAVARLAELPRPLAALVVQRLADAAAGGPAPGVGARVGEILALRADGELHLGCGLRAVIRAGRMSLAPLA